MKTRERMTALLEFDGNGELRAIFPNAESDEQERRIKEALTRLIRPSLWEYFVRITTGESIK